MILTGVALWLCAFANAATSSHSRDAKLLRLLDKNVTVTQTAGEGGDVFFMLCHDLAIPCGEETFSGGILFWPPIVGRNFRHESMSLRHALNRIIHRQPQYKWEISDGVLVLAPHTPNKFSPLDKPVSHFKARSELLTDVTSQVIDLMGIQHVMGLGGPWSAYHSEIKLNFELKNTTARAVLNAAVNSHGHAFWEFTYLSRSQRATILNHPSFDLQSYAY